MNGTFTMLSTVNVRFTVNAIMYIRLRRYFELEPLRLHSYSEILKFTILGLSAYILYAGCIIWHYL
eukprot:SAG22_NODE_11294_length_492_cov_0.613232_1_plen_65_part_01